MFEKNLNDLVRGLRNNKSNEAKYVAECLDEIKQELRQENMAVKANAVLKLSYIQMFGYDVSWAAFNIIEVMSSQKFTHKRIAYMAASQSFHSELDVLMLATNLIKKDMNSQNQYDSGVAMAGLSCFISPDLARDLANDIMTMMISSKPYVRKRAVLLIYKVFLNFPDALRPAFSRLKERLEDQESGVQCAAVNVICELARKNPKNYLALAPLFFKLMTSSSNNWMLIKIIKLFGALCPLEPRLGKKLQEPLTSLLHSTSAMSLLYECINTLIAGLPEHQPSMQLCVSKLRLLIEDPDQNLKYLGLLSLNNILKSQPKLVLGHRDLIMKCLEDKDESIRYRALDLIVGMVSKKTLVDIIKKLMQYMEATEDICYRDELLSKIIQICSQSNYQYVTNFEWYIDVLIQLSKIADTKHGKMIANQMLDVTIRVKAVRPYAVPAFAQLLSRATLVSGSPEKNSSCEVLFASAWVAGEFAEYLSDMNGVLDCLLHPRVASLPGHIHSVFIQSIAKFFSRTLSQCEEQGNEQELDKIGEKLISALPLFTQSSDLEVQDRACCVLQLIKLVLKMKKEGVSCGAEVAALFSEELLPVAPKAQKKVPVPEGLDLDKWINDPLSESSEGEEDTPQFLPDDKGASLSPSHQESGYKEIKLDEEELKKRKEARKLMQESNPHYLKMDAPTKKKNGDISVDDIPVQELDLPVTLRLEKGSVKATGKKEGRKRKGKKGRKQSESEEEGALPVYEIAPVVDLDAKQAPESEELNPNDPHALLNVDLDTPLGAHEILPVAQHRVVDSKATTEPKADTKGKKSKKAKPVKDGKKKHRKRADQQGDDKAEEDTHEKKKTPRKERTKSKRGSSLKEEGHRKKKSNADASSESEAKATLLAQASQYAKAAGVTSENVGKPAETLSNKETSNDDMSFWLSTPKSDEKKLPADQPQSALVAATAVEPPGNDAPSAAGKAVSQTKKKSKEKQTKVKGDKKRKTKRTSSEGQPIGEQSTPGPAEVSMMMDIEETAHDPYALYSLLCEDSNLKLMYEIRCDPMKRDQVIVSIIFRNLTKKHIQALEFNVLDSLSLKLVRQLGASAHDAVKVPFQLLPEMTNEGQFAFTVESVVMAQWLRGTVTYFIKGTDGSTSEKIDFKINFPVSSYCLARPLTSHEFAALLSSGDLSEKQSIKVSVPSGVQLPKVVQAICKKLRTVVVELVDHGASVYAHTIQDHSVCLLVKLLPGDMVSIDAKASSFQLLSSVMNEIKDAMAAV